MAAGGFADAGSGGSNRPDLAESAFRTLGAASGRNQTCSPQRTQIEDSDSDPL